MSVPVMSADGKPSQAVNEKENQILLEPHVFGSNLPKIKVIDVEKLMRAYDFWLNIPKDKFEIIKEISEITFESSVLIDDLLNNSVLTDKKGPTVQEVYGIPFTLNSANYAGVVALQKCVHLHNPKAVEICAKKSIQFYRGDIADVIWKNEGVCPDEDEYLKKRLRKQRVWFELPLQLMKLFSDKNIDLNKLTEIFAKYFQIYEDYLNVCSIENPWSRNFLGVGIFNFPVVHALKSQGGNNEIIDLYSKKENDNKAKEKLLSLLRESGSLQYTREILLKLRDEAEEEMKKLDDNPYIFQFIEDTVCNLHVF